MPDEITPEERALIDQAVKNGKVQIIPKGQSGIPSDVMSYREMHNQLNSKFMIERKKAGDETRRRIKNLLSQGFSIEQISERIALKAQYVKYHISKMEETKQLDGDAPSC
jgi:hypothetical protein